MSVMKYLFSFFIVGVSMNAYSNTDKIQKYKIKRGDEQTYTAYVAPNIGLTLQYPEPWVGKVFCGDCLFPGNEAKGQLFKIEVSEQTNQIAVVPTGVPGMNGAPPGPGYVTAITVTLRSGITVSTLLRASLPEQSSTRVIFELPQQENADSILSIEKKKLNDQFETKVNQAATQRSLDFLLDETKCRNFVGAPYRNDGFIVRLRQICRTKRSVWVVFEAQNRLKATDILLKEAVLSGSTDFEGRDFRFRKQTLEFDDKTVGTAIIEMPNEDPLPPTWTLTVTEDGGKERQIVANNISF